MASDIKIKFDTEAFDEFLRLECANTKCKFNYGFRCQLKHISINEDGKCSEFLKIASPCSKLFHSVLRAEGKEKCNVCDENIVA